jgi:hypothetical protein
VDSTQTDGAGLLLPESPIFFLTFKANIASCNDFGKNTHSERQSGADLGRPLLEVVM